MAKKKITESTKVQVYNNVNNEVIFDNADGRTISIRKGGQYKLLTVRDLEAIHSNAPAMLEEGVLFIKNVDVREHLDIAEFYKDGSIIPLNEIGSLLKKDSLKVQDMVKKASESAKREIVKEASKNQQELTVGVIETVEKETGASLIK